MAVNDVNLEHVTLDRAVQVLKGAPKGPVKITVSKPLSTSDAVSHTSQVLNEFRFFVIVVVRFAIVPDFPCGFNMCV